MCISFTKLSLRGAVLFYLKILMLKCFKENLLNINFSRVKSHFSYFDPIILLDLLMILLLTCYGKYMLFAC